MIWTALVPFKSGGQRKSRLAPELDADARLALSEAMCAHVLGVLQRAPGIGKTLLLSGHQGLNAELACAAAKITGPLLVIHADLPALAEDEVDQILAAAGTGVAIAPDRRGTGTNALALFDRSAFTFAFGPDSFRQHVEAAAGRAAIVHAPGLSLDLDTPEDIAAALALPQIDATVRRLLGSPPSASQVPI